MSAVKYEALRDYQLELFYKIKNRKSCILFLPAGSGKTHIAFRVINSMVADLRKPIGENGKRSFFLVNTVHLVHQQAAVLTRLGNFRVSRLAGEVRFDGFRKKQWDSLLRSFEVFVITSQIFLNALTHGYLTFENANLIIFDECHHATGYHPMAQIMRRVRDCHPEKRPKILGLTAILLKTNVKSVQIGFEEKLRELERVFDGEIITSKKSKVIRNRFSAKPNEIIQNVKRYCIPDRTKENLKILYDQGMKILQVVKIRRHHSGTVDSDGKDKIRLDRPDYNRLRQLRSVLADILTHTNECGLFLGYICCHYYIIQLGRYTLTSKDPRFTTFILYIMNLARLMRKVLSNDIIIESPTSGNSDSTEIVEVIRSTSTSKIQYLFDRIRAMSPSDRCIVFVEKKMTAKSLYRILKIFIEKCLNNTMSIDFVIGINKNPLRNTKEGLYDKEEKREKILKNFSAGLLNVLVSTSILEEGINVQECNIVIMFDGVKSFSSYIQSRGRARMRGSQYIVLNHTTDAMDTRIEFFRQIDTKMNDIFDQKDVPVSAVRCDSSDTVERDIYTTSKGATVDSATALHIVYWYCSTLPEESFMKSLPRWYYDRDRGTCSVKLPSAAGVYSLIEGPSRSNRKEAKQAAALEVVIHLHKKGILNDHLDPTTRCTSDVWFSSGMDEDQSAPSKMINSPSRVPVFLKNCRPLPYQQCYLHCLKFSSEDEPVTARQRFCHELMRAGEYNFGILTRNEWPEICRFPVYSDLGEVRVEVEPNYRTLYFTNEKLKEISRFHRNLFLNILKAVRKCFAYDDKDNCDSGYFIVPLQQNKSTLNYEISWQCINAEFPSEISEPIRAGIDDQEYSPRNYVGKVVTQWYKPGIPHIVYEVSDAVFLKSHFRPNITYEEYFKERHNVKSRRPDNQPMLLVRPITSLTDSIKPKGRGGEQKKIKKGEETYLAPEFCYVYPIPAVFWYKSIVLPSVLHRVHHLLLAEDLRQRMVIEAKVGSLKLPKDSNPERVLEHFREEKSNYKKFIPEPEVPKQRSKVRKRCSMRLYNFLHPKCNGAGKTEKLNSTGRENDAMMVDKSMSSPATLVKVDALHDLKLSADYFDIAIVALLRTKSTADGHSAPLFKKKKKNCKYEVPDINFISSPELSTLRNHDPVNHGPRSHQILEAITLRDAQDVLHLERLETLGDSCLKYIVSFFLFTKGDAMDEGDLTILKSQIVSNKNLFERGEKIEIGSYIKVINFSTKIFWCPPGFSVPLCFLKNPLVQDASNVTAFSSLLKLEIPSTEQFSGKISESTRNQKLSNIEVDAVNDLREIDFLLGKHKLAPKNISDVLEAILGVYSVNAGIESAFKILHYFGILDDMENFIPHGMPDHPSASVYAFLSESDVGCIERLLKYEFKNKAHLLQALTHASFSENHLTGSYEKFEFLGDAILDFLITSFLYEYHQHLDPGQLTDLRSALVNNVTFGSLTVRLGLHQFLLSRCQQLLDAIETFAARQKKRNHPAAPKEFMNVIKENNNTIAEEVEVPKTLGDIFESIAAAIFIDSGFNLEVVWKIYYNFMRNEIEKFSKKIPINPVRELYEKNLALTFNTVDLGTTSDKIFVSLKVVTPKKKTFLFMGKGENTKAAKRAVARLALQNLTNDTFLVKV